nr:glucosaminidase domain-containing protein [Halalkalibacillus sediminis]
MNQFVKSINPNAKELGAYYLKFGQYYGIRGDIAFAQAMHETNYLRFTGVVQPEQNNFSGLGATGSDNPGASFDTPEESALAHIQHLYAYASTEPLPDKYPLVDPRFNLVTRGSATTWQALNGKWAVPGENYGQSILQIYEKALENSIQNLEKTLQEVKENSSN